MQQEFIKRFLLSVSDGHYLYMMSSDTLFAKIDPHCKIWKYNRNLDKNRAKEMKEEHKRTGRMDGIISCGCIDGILFIYDGNHRYQSLVSKMPYVLVDILWDCNDESMRREFIRINRCVKVPDLYMQDSRTDNNVDLVEKYMRDFCKRFRSAHSTSSNPKRPHFNRDNVVDQITSFYEEYDSLYTIEQILSSLDVLNDRYADGNNPRKSRIDGSTHSKTVYKISNASTAKDGLYLFIESRWFNRKLLRRVLEELH